MRHRSVFLGKIARALKVLDATSFTLSLMISIVTLELTFIVTSGSVMAGEPSFSSDAPKNVVKVGAYHFFVNDDAAGIAGPFTPAGATANVIDTTSFAFVYQRFLTDSLSIQVAGGYPPKFGVDGDGVIGGLGEVVTLTALNPTIFLSYHFLDRTAAIRPFLGVGVNYTNFVDEQSTAALDAALFGSTRVSLSSFVAVAVTAGADIRIAGPWTASVSLSYLSADTDATLVTGGISRTMNIELDPVTFFIGIGYEF